MAAEMARRGSLQVDPHHPASNITALSDEVAEVLSRDFTFALKLDLLLAFVKELLYASLKSLTKLVGRELKCSPDLGRDSCSVGVCVV
jgi:hypothetical protein